MHEPLCEGRVLDRVLVLCVARLQRSRIIVRHGTIMSYTLLELTRQIVSAEALLSSPTPRVPIRRIIRLFRPYRWSLLFVAVLVGTSSLVSLVNPFLIREVIAVPLPRGRTGLPTPRAPAHFAVSMANSPFPVPQ